MQSLPYAAPAPVTRESWGALSPDARNEIRRSREKKIEEAAATVRRNERDASILEAIARSGNANLVIRDMYFGIADETLRKKAINDFAVHEELHINHGRACIREAMFSRDDALTRKPKLGCLPFSAVFFAMGVAAYLEPTWRTALSLCATFLIGVFWANLLFANSQKRLETIRSQLAIEIEIARWGAEMEELAVRPSVPLFSERERETGKRQQT